MLSVCNDLEAFAAAIADGACLVFGAGNHHIIPCGQLFWEGFFVNGLTHIIVIGVGGQSA